MNVLADNQVEYVYYVYIRILRVGVLLVVRAWKCWVEQEILLYAIFWIVYYENKSFLISGEDAGQQKSRQ